jgi:protein O-mannosyl-transferase
MKGLHMSRADSSPRISSTEMFFSRLGHVPFLAVIFITLLTVYANSFSGAWVFDDIPNIVRNQAVHLDTLDREAITGTFYGIRDKVSRPLAYLSFGINHYFHGLEVFGYHLVNLTIHCLAALFLYLFVHRTLNLPILKYNYGDRSRITAFLSALLWSSSPINVTAVTYIVQRMASMAAMFFIMAMYFYLMGRTTSDTYRRLGWFGLCGMAGVLSLASKENAVMLPVILYLFDLILIRGFTGENLLRHLRLAVIPVALVAGLTFFLSNPLNILSGYDNREFTVLERLLTQPRILLFYLTLMLYPIPERFTLVHEIQLSTSLVSPWTTLPAIIFWTGWLVLGLYLAGRRPLTAFCLLFFLANHVVESSIIPLELIYEHRNYLPSMTLYILAGLAVDHLLFDFKIRPVLRGFIILAVGVTMIVHGHSVWHRNALFKDPLLIWRDNVMKSPGLSRVYTNLGNAFMRMDMPEKAKPAYLKAVEADRYHRHKLRAVPLNNLGNYYLRAGDPVTAAGSFEQSLKADPHYPMARRGVIVALLMQKDLDSAESRLDQFLADHPGDSNLLVLNSMLHLKRGRHQIAVREARKALRNDPDSTIAHKLLGEAYTRLGEYALARQSWEIYARANPEDLEAGLALVNLADVLKDKELLRRSANRVVTIKGERSWEELFQTLDRVRELNDLVLSGDPRDLLALIRQGLE